MKKLSIIVLMMALLMTMVLVGCDSDTSETTETTESDEQVVRQPGDAGQMVDSSTRVSFGANMIETHHTNTSNQPSIIFSAGNLGTVMPRVTRGGGDNVTTAPGYRIIMIVDGVVYQVGEMSAVGT